MNFEKVKIAAVSDYLPENLVTSNDIEAQLKDIYENLKLPFGRLELMSGIQTRGIWPNGTKPSALSTHAGKKAIANANINPNSIDLLIHASVCRDFLEPATASIVHSQLGLSDHCMIFDLSNACLGVLNAMVMSANMIESGTIKTALIVSGENSGPLLTSTIEYLKSKTDLTRKNIKKYFANLTIGSAATAILLTHSDLCPQGISLLGGASLTDSSASDLCQGTGNSDHLYMETDSEKLMEKGISLAKRTWENTKINLGWDNDTPTWAIGHQVGRAHEELLFKTLQLENKKSLSTYPKYGNTGSSALPLTLSKLIDTRNPSKDDLIALLGIGSGLSSVMLGLKC